jgi:hypothetical protein
MKIVKSCDEKLPTSVKMGEIVVGTVFYYGTPNAGPFLRISGGAVSLVRHVFSADGQFPTLLTNYVPLPNAKLVTGEET